MSDKKSSKIAAVILAGDMAEGMPSNTPLVLHPLAGQPLIMHTVNAIQKTIGDFPFLVIEKDNGQIQRVVDQSAKYIVLDELKGSAHHLMQTEHLLRNTADYLLVISADMPLLTSNTLEQFLAAHLEPVEGVQSPSPITILSFQTLDSQNYPRLIRGEDGNIEAISDRTDVSTDGLKPVEYDAGVYCFTAEWLWQALPISSGSEHRLIDMVQMAIADGLPVKSISLTNPIEALRIENRIDLAEAEAVLRQRINEDLMLNGVTIIDPSSTYIDAQVEIGLDTVIHPNTYLRGTTRIGEGCTIGPNCFVVDTTIGDNCEIIFSETENAILEDDVDIGPFAHLRKGAHLAQGVHMGNYGEVKDSYLGPGTKMGHFSYIGDANIGPGVNIGAGVITANYDGKNKYHTEIGAGAFIGSDSMLIAPLKIGEGARTGAGSVVTKDVPANSLAVGIPARVIRKKEEKDGS
jgi:bifunctional UDP-N-acetylglucosamine pyrophosphorylase/glucosamine-1-phosphate N-acetyltransferase